MKFLCDNCKAKYQIADDKVAGKTVRMKCRKCGHQIEVRSAVTEGTGSIPPPAPLPGVKAPPRIGGLATSLSAQKPKAPAISTAPGSALAGAFAKNVADAPASVSGSGTGAGGSSIELSVTDEWYVAINGVPVGPVRISELRRKAATGAVNDDSLCWQEGLEEWRPIKSIPDLAVIVREAAAGNRPSLADASPNRISGYPSAPKMPAVRQSTIPPAPLMPSASMPVSSPISPPVTSPMNAPVRQASPLAAAARSNVVPLRPNAPTGPQMSPSMDDFPAGPFGGSGAAAAFAPTPSPLAPQTSPLPVSSPMMPAAPPAPDPFAPSGPMPTASPSPFSLGPPPGSMSPQPAANPLMSSSPSFGDQNSLSRPSFHPPQPSFSNVPSGPIGMPMPVAAPEKKGGTPLWFWPILVLFLGFGGGAAFFVFNRVQPQPVVIQMPATPTSTAAPPPTDSVAAMDLPANSADAPTIEANNAAPKKGGGPKKPASGPAPAAEAKGGGLNLEGLGGGTGGPNVGPGPGGGAGGGGGLDQAGVERVVSAHRAGVKRTCWERGGADQKSSVNVTVAANVAPNGQVSSVSSSGDDPVVGKCIESQVKTWTFPAPGSPTTINIPFKFVRQ